MLDRPVDARRETLFDIDDAQFRKASHPARVHAMRSAVQPRCLLLPDADDKGLPSPLDLSSPVVGYRPSTPDLGSLINGSQAVSLLTGAAEPLVLAP